MTVDTGRHPERSEVSQRSLAALKMAVASSLDDADRDEARDFFREARPIDDIDHCIHIFVGFRRLFDQALARSRFRDDAEFLQTISELRCRDLLPRARSRHHAPRAVTTRSEALLHRALLSHQHV